ncbi:MAG: DUF2628 domain-containing protein [Alphaproteobacteria bacterium]|nr:DUF2628 domain-containing protein [Alphaproteobacteria bacterium]
MRIYTVHRRSRGAAGAEAVAPAGAAARVRAWLSGAEGEDVVLVREGFAWMAALAGPLWALWHRLWGFAVLIVAAELALAMLLELARDPALEAASALALAALIGCSANDVRRSALARRAMPAVAVVAASDSDSAMLRYLDRAAGTASP